jgi:hypothetical protein
MTGVPTDFRYPYLPGTCREISAKGDSGTNEVN